MKFVIIVLEIHKCVNSSSYRYERYSGVYYTNDRSIKLSKTFNDHSVNCSFTEI